MLNVICERMTGELGPEYVAILQDMVRRNLPDNMVGRFVCVTDQPEPLPGSVETDLSKLLEGGKVLRLPLNCMVIGPIDKIVAHEMFETGNPTIKQISEAFPGQVVDYSERFPSGAKIVLFPDKQPHECDGWVKEVWKMGGGTAAELAFDSNVTAERIVNNLRAAHARPTGRWIKEADAHEGVAVVAAGGPSLKRCIELLTSLQKGGATVFALNRVPAFLKGYGIVSDAHVLLDAIPDVIEFVDNSVPMERYYSSQCDPGVLDAAGEELVIWDPYIEGILDAVPEASGPFIGGGTTVGTRAIGLAYMLGYRKIHVFGLDSSCEDGQAHAYSQIEYGSMLEVTFEGKSYKTPPQLLAQVEDFKKLVPEILAQGVELIIHGDGLLPDVAASIGQQMMAA